MKKILLSLCALLFAQHLFAQSVTILDKTYGNGGMASVGGMPGKAAAEFNGKVIVAGNSGNYVTVARFAEDGTLDGTFGNKGLIQYNLGQAVTTTSAAIDPANGNIYVAGYTTNSTNSSTYGFITSWKVTGDSNTTFASGGILLYPDARIRFNTIGIQSGSRIVVAGDTIGSLGKYFIARFDQYGKKDKSFAGVKSMGNRSGTIMYMDIVNDTIALTGNYIITTTEVTAVKLAPDGQIDPKFKSIKIIDITGSDKPVGVRVQPDGKLVVGCTGSTGGVKVYRLLNNGAQDSTFNKTGLFSYTGSYNPTGLLLDKYQRVIVTGLGSNAGVTQQFALRIAEDGTLNNNFGIFISNSSTGTTSGSLISSDERLMIIGTFLTGTTAVINNASVTKVNMKNIHGLYFGTIPLKYIGSDPFTLNASTESGAPIAFSTNKPSIASIQGKTVTVKDTGRAFVKAYVDEVPFNPADPSKPEYYSEAISQQLWVLANPPAIIAGEKTITDAVVESYRILPSLANAEYNWSYQGDSSNIQILSGSYDSTFTIFYKKGFKGLVLSCTVYLGNTSFEIEKTIVSNPDGSSSGTIGDIVCSEQYASCFGNYIDGFRLNTLQNLNSGCSMGGYADYTASGLKTELFLGGVYSAHVKISSAVNQSRYIGMWVDYNNNGEFSPTDEFLGVSFTNDTTVKLNNIIFKNDPSYAGARRVRVRCRSNVPFTGEEACQQANESGETEDYLVILKEQDALQGPQVITPNYDGKNDFLVFRGVNSKHTNKLVVFDKMGNVKFTKENYQNDWDGKDEDGETLAKGTYYYIFTNGQDSVKGFFEILY